MECSAGDAQPDRREGCEGTGEERHEELAGDQRLATWCGPCVAEMPELIKLPQMYHARGFEFITISADDVAKTDRALALLKGKHVAATNYIFSFDDHDVGGDGLRSVNCCRSW